MLKFCEIKRFVRCVKRPINRWEKVPKRGGFRNLKKKAKNGEKVAYKTLGKKFGKTEKIGC